MIVLAEQSWILVCTGQNALNRTNFHSIQAILQYIGTVTPFIHQFLVEQDTTLSPANVVSPRVAPFRGFVTISIHHS